MFNIVEVGCSRFIRFSGQWKKQVKQYCVWDQRLRLNTQWFRCSHRLGILFALLTAVLGANPGQAASPIVTPLTVYVEPALWLVPTNEAAVIITATDRNAAYAAVIAVGGRVTSDLWLINGVGARVPTARLAELRAYPGLVAITVNHGVRSAGTTYVQPTANPTIWNVLSPVSVDVGANLVHTTPWNGLSGITGSGVTIAVVDSGVAFNSQVANQLGSQVVARFRGQIDFVGTGQCQVQGVDVVQGNGYCQSGTLSSIDPYGHGTHVAGIIWNRYTDLRTGATLGVAPNADVLSIRVLGADGGGAYEDVVEGIQYAVAHQAEYQIRIVNLSLVGTAQTPYFIDPVNRAVEAAWANGLVVIAAAGNSGPNAQTITVPGNDPYIITVGSLNTNGTANNWDDDYLSPWSAAGPTLDGFIKPDLLAPGSNVVAYVYNDLVDSTKSAYLVRNHPDFQAALSLYRLSGTSMATAATSGVAALLLEARPTLTPDQVKYRLMETAKQLSTPAGEPIYSPLRQGSGRIWAPDAVFSESLPNGIANAGLNVHTDIANQWRVDDEPRLTPAVRYQLRNQPDGDNDNRVNLTLRSGETRQVRWGYQVQRDSDRTHLDFSQREKNRIQKNAVTSKPFQ
jgi:serine protease AprX